MKQISRRQFLQGTTGMTFAFISGCKPRARTEPISEPAATAIASPSAAAKPEITRPPGDATPDLAGARLPSDEIIVTPNEQFYLNYFNTASVGITIDDWRLELGGLVETPVALAYDELLALPAVEEMRTLECIGNPVGGDLIGNAVWKGFELAALLREVGIKPQTRRARLAAADGYWTSVDLHWITQPGVLMAYEMNGEPLPTKHGYPLRILMPGLYGQKMPKWVTGIRFEDEVTLGYWENRGWSDVASVQTNSHIWQPADLEVVTGDVVISGMAYAAPREIVKVEVGIDDETWLEAELLKGATPLVWTQWRAVWTAAQGDYRLSVRATDAEGFTQVGSGARVLQNAFPDGTNAIHEIVVTVKEP